MLELAPGQMRGHATRRNLAFAFLDMSVHIYPIRENLNEKWEGRGSGAWLRTRSLTVDMILRRRVEKGGRKRERERERERERCPTLRPAAEEKPAGLSPPSVHVRFAHPLTHPHSVIAAARHGFLYVVQYVLSIYSFLPSFTLSSKRPRSLSPTPREDC